MADVICAWCKAVLGSKETAGGQVSHGICEDCLKKQKAELAELKRGKAMPKMKGHLAMLETFAADGQAIAHQLVFEPTCNWYWPAAQDFYAQTEYTELQTIIDEFGIDVAERVFLKGEVVEVERAPPTDLELRECPRSKDPPIKVSHSLARGGTKQSLVRQSIAEKLGRV